jgi:hypothetical protein
MRHLRIPSILMVLVTGAALVGAAPVHAEIGIAVAPALIELEGDAGQAGSVDITVSNRGDEPFDAVTAIDVFEGMIDERSAVTWSTLTPKRFRLEPGASGTATYRVEIPRDAVSGGRYAELSFAAAPIPNQADPSPAAASAIAGRIVIPVLLTVHGEGELDRTTELTRSGLFLEPDGRLGVRAEVANSGNVHVPLIGRVEVTGEQLATPATLDIQLGRVLPGTSRTYAPDSTLPLLPDATYHVTVDMGVPDSENATTFEPTLRGESDVMATPSLTLTGLAICERLDGPPDVTLTLTNEGSLGVVPTAGFQVLDAADVPVASTTATNQQLSWPGTETVYVATLPAPLASGTYTLVGAVVYGDGIVQEARLPFGIGESTNPAPPCAPDPAASIPPAG